MNKRWIALMVALIVISVVMAGSVQPVPAAAQTPELVIWAREDFPINFDEIGRAFLQDHGIGIKVETMSMDTLRQRFPAEGAGEAGPDIVMDSDDLIDQYRDAVGLEPIVLGNRVADYIPFAIQAFSRGDHLYGLPFALESLAFVRNTRLVPDMPKTWGDVMEISQHLKQSSAAELGFVLPSGDLYSFYPILTAYGGYVFGQHDDGTFNPGDIGLNNDGAIAALGWMRQMAQAGLMPPDMSWDDAQAAITREKAAMIITGPWAVGTLDDSGIPYAVSAFPAGVQPGEPWVHVHGFMINAHSKNKDAAQLFLTEYLAIQPTMQTIYEAIRRVPAHMGVFERMDDPVTLGFVDALQNGQRFPNIPEMGPVWGAMTSAIQDVRGGNQDPAVASHDAVATIRQQIGQ
jgi:arabinogalactan oligomer/maltooligosaccharide transport system substrate-binding protein